MSTTEALGRDDLLWLLGSLSSLYRLPFDPALIAQQFPPPYKRSSFHQVARALGLKTATLPHAGSDWHKLPLPAIAFLNTASTAETNAGSEASEGATQVPVLILKTDAPKEALLGDGHKLLYFRSGSQTPETLTLAAAAGVFTPSCSFRDKLNRQFMLGARNQAFPSEYLAAGFSTKQVGNTYNVISNGLEQVMTLSILIVGALLVMQNDGFTVGMLLAFQMFASRMSQPMLRLVGLWQEFQQANIAVKRLGDILDMPQEPHALVPSREGTQMSAHAQKGQLDLINLAFRYSEQHPWLYRQLNLRFKPGHLTVLMGPSGCGKSTLAKLLLGFYQPSDGLIQLDGKDIRHLAANELRATFGVVPQETILFAGTLYDNLVMAHPHASFEDVIEACKAAEIHEVIEKLPAGYQTEIGERGSGLSGGQKQRIAIARALLKKPRILIFDEAVSNLDTQTAEHFARTINKLKGLVTMIFITHQIPRGLMVDEVFGLGGDHLNTTKVEVVGEEKT